MAQFKQNPNNTEWINPKELNGGLSLNLPEKKLSDLDM